MIFPEVTITKSSQETFNLGVAMAKTLKGSEVIALHGDLGSGKTVFAQGLAYGLGISQKVTSPTFLILKQYQVKSHLITNMYHADLYRIGSEQGVKEIGLVEMMKNPHAVTIIEWPEKMAELLPAKTIHRTFLYDGEDDRLVIEGTLAGYIKQAVNVVKSGGIIIFPTDTAFGIGCRIDNDQAVRKLFALSERPVNKATPVLFESIKQVSNYVQEIPSDVRENLMEKYWPGALTIVLEANTKKVNSLVRGGGTTIAVRIPGNEVIQNIIKNVGVPIIGTSANFNSKSTPYQYGDLDPNLCELVDYVVPGVCTVKKESTVIDVTVSPWKILRQGAVIVNN